MTTEKTRTVLLVEDEDTVLLALQTALTDQGWRVLTATNGLEALAVYDLHHESIDVLVTDMEMPGLNGPSLAQQVLQKRPTLAILFMSGGSVADPLPPSAGCRRQGFLQKPFMLADLYKRLNELFT